MRKALLAIVALALYCAPAGMAAPSSGSVGENALTIATVPQLVGVRFELGDTVIETGPDGTARIVLPGSGVYPLRILDETARHGAVRSRFSRWGDNSFTPSRTIDIHGATRLEVGFQQSVLVGFRFLDRADRSVDTARVSKLALASTIGTHQSFRPDRPHWLIAGRVTRRFGGLEQTQIQYAVEKAVVDGSNVVNRAQQRFYPLRRRSVDLHLLLYSARLSAHDFLFGFSVGKRLELIYPNGHRVTRRLEGGKLFLPGLPRGTYGIRAQAGGYSPVVSLALSKDQVLDLKVVSYLDLFVVGALAVTVAALLVLLPRPRLRQRLRTRATRGLRGGLSALRRVSERLRPAFRPLAERLRGRPERIDGPETVIATALETAVAGNDPHAHRAYIDALIAQGIGPTRGLALYRQAGGAIRNKEWFAAYRATEESLRLRRESVARTLAVRRIRPPVTVTLSSERARASVRAMPARELE